LAKSLPVVKFAIMTEGDGAGQHVNQRTGDPDSAASIA
jgi:hypothetical protein